MRKSSASSSTTENQTETNTLQTILKTVDDKCLSTLG